MKMFIAIITLLLIGACSSMNVPRRLTESEISYLTELSQSLSNDFSNRIDAPITTPVGQGCFFDSNCKGTWRCENIEGVLNDAFTHTTHETNLQRVKRKAKISGKECIRPVTDVLDAYPKDQLENRIAELLAELNEVMEGADLKKYGVESNETLKATLSSAKNLNVPITRAAEIGHTDALSQIFLLLAIRGKDGDISMDEDIISLLYLTQAQDPHGVDFGSNVFNNPFMLYTLLSGSKSASKILTFSLFANGNIGYPTHDTSTRHGEVTHPQTQGYDTQFGAFSSPLILLSLLGDDGKNSNDDLLYFVLTSGFGGSGYGGGQGGITDSILPLLFLKDDKSDIGDLLFPLLLSGGLGGGNDGGYGGNDLSSLLPLFFLSNKTGDGLGDILPYILLFGNGAGHGTGFGAGGGGLDLLLPLLLTKNNTDFKHILPLFLFGGLGGGKGGDISSILPFLLFGDGNLTDIFPLLFLFGGLGGQGYGDLGSQPHGSQPQGGINPIMLLYLLDLIDLGHGNGGKDLFPLLFLTGGFGGDLQSILPYIVLMGDGTKDTLPLIFLLGFLNKGPQVYSQPDPFGSPNIYG